MTSARLLTHLSCRARDAHLVALMLQTGVRTIWTHDRDYRKFRGITVRDPFDRAAG